MGRSKRPSNQEGRRRSAVATPTSVVSWSVLGPYRIGNLRIGAGMSGHTGRNESLVAAPSRPRPPASEQRGGGFEPLTLYKGSIPFARSRSGRRRTAPIGQLEGGGRVLGHPPAVSPWLERSSR